MPSVSTTGSNAIVRSALGANHRPNSRILPDVEMREELAVLEHEPDAAPIFRHIHPRLDVDQRAAVEHDAAAIGPCQPGNQIDGGRLAGPGPAEQGGDARIVLEGNIEIEAAECERCVDPDAGMPVLHHAAPGCRRCRQSKIMSRSGLTAKTRYSMAKPRREASAFAPSND